jgi:Mg-chelatase subunit ChlD
MAKPSYKFFIISLIMFAQLPAFGQSVDWVHTIYPEEQSATKNNDRVVIIAHVVGSPRRVVCDASIFGDSSQMGFPSFDMYDDGVHNDSLFNDGIYGTIPIVVRSFARYHPVKVIPYPTGGIGYGKIGVDNTTPYVWEAKPIYPGAQSAAREHDTIRITARARDALPSIDIVLVTDNSGSMKDTIPRDTISKMDIVKLAVNKLMDRLESGDRVALYAFDGGYNAYAKRYTEFIQNKDTIIEIVNTFTPHNNSPLYDALFMASQHAQKSPNFTAVIALTDGRNYAPRGQLHNRYDCYLQPIPIFVVGIGGALKIDKGFLDSLATTSARGKYYYTIFEKDIDVIYQEILEIIKSTEIPIGVSELIVDTKPIGGHRDELLFDDGYHDDGYADDNIYGSDPVPVNTDVTAVETLAVRVIDIAQNQAIDLIYLAVDNMPPNISAFVPHYMRDNFAAFDDDSIYYTTEVNDLGMVGGIKSVKLDASSIGGGAALVMKDDGMINDTLANDGVYTSRYIKVSTGGATSILTVKMVTEDVAGNNSFETTNTLVDNSIPMISSGEVIYPFNQTSAKWGDFIKVVARIEEKSSGFKDGFPYVDASTIRGPKNIPLYDDGYHLDNAAGDGIFGTDSIKVIVNNPQTITIHVEDGAASRDAFALDVEVFKAIAPAISIVKPTEDAEVVGSLTLQASVNEEEIEAPISTVEFSLDEGDWVSAGFNPLTGYYEYEIDTRTMSEDFHYVIVRVFDSSGNMKTDGQIFTVDNTAPSLTIVYPRASEALSDIVALTIDSQDNLSGFDGTGGVWYSVDMGAWTQARFDSIEGKWKGELVTNDLREGEHVLNLKAMDDAGNTTLDHIYVMIDNTLPTCKIVSPSDDVYARGKTLFRVSAYDNLAISNVQLGDKPMGYNDLSGYYEYELNTKELLDGVNNIVARAYDRAGNSVDDTVFIKIDNTPPVAVIKIEEGLYTVDVGRYTITLATYEPLVDIPSLSYVPEGHEPIPIEMSGFGTFFQGTMEITGEITDAACKFIYTGKDLAGNVGNEIRSGKDFYIYVKR